VSEVREGEEEEAFEKEGGVQCRDEGERVERRERGGRTVVDMGGEGGGCGGLFGKEAPESDNRGAGEVRVEGRK
jgi:hypothetical protein